MGTDPVSESTLRVKTQTHLYKSRVADFNVSCLHYQKTALFNISGDDII